MDLKANDYPWCEIESKGNKIIFYCVRCLENHKFDNTGMSIDDFLKKCEAFCMLHKDCEKG